MAWFGGKVSLGGFPDLAGAVNKLSESVKNIEKNFDTALGFEEKAEKSEFSNSEGLWPVMSFMGQRSEESTSESPEKPESLEQPLRPEEKEGVETERLLPSTTEQTSTEEERDALKTVEDNERTVTAERVDIVTSDLGKVESESLTMPVGPPDSTIQNVESSDSVDNLQQKETSGIAPSEESVEANSEPVEADQAKGGTIILPDESDNVVDPHESKDEEKKEESKDEEKKEECKDEEKKEESKDEDKKEESKGGEKTQAEEIVEKSLPVEAEASSAVQAEGTKPSDSHSASVEETDSACGLSLPSSPPSDEAPEMVSASNSPQKGAEFKAVEVDQQANVNEIDTREQQLSSEVNVPVSEESVLELGKLKMEMKMMETALQGAARQAQAKADEIAKMMNENEHLKAVIEDLKRKSNDAEIETLREEYHQRVGTLERRVYALTKERDTLRREQNKKSDAAALLKEKDEIINQVMAEGEELSKKQAAQEAQIRKLRAQIRELEEEKKGLATKLQVEENKVESIKKDKTATEKLLQETIEKHQVELATQKQYYTNALNAAKEAEELAEARANNEARTELESRLREAEEREAMLVQALEELRQTLSRKEQQAVFREDMLRRDIEDLQKRYQASERRCEELITQVPESTRPLLRQIEAIQETTARRAEAWAAVERSLNSRLQEAEAKAAAAEERERSVNERLSQTLSRINVLEAQISCLRAEQTQLSKSLEKERQRAAENRQEYLAAKEEADTQAGRASQLEEEIKELRRKHKQELQDALMHRELLQQEIDREKAARLDLERRASAHSTAVPDQTPLSRHNSAFENGSLSRKLSSASSLGSMEESHFLQASLDSSDSLSEKRNPIEATMNPYFMKSMTPSAFESSLRQKEGELASYMSRLASMESIRDSLAEELVKMTGQCEKLRAEAAMLPGIRAELDALRRRHAAALELMGERDEELEELRADIIDLKEMYREQVNLLVNKIQVMSSSMGNA
ncbi:golgin candidate 5 [Pistacia vera]|uniref:golgin candidate 5 n=1 Tax=Pistacia vera TaxID=55513 RepID=UPI001262B3F5|nr:golgin candidate 5 [Pistacia vera]XP_031277722.1 golgin candidate 5 [Pistacia vera]